MKPTASQKKMKNRNELRSLGHTSTHSAIGEIKNHIPTFSMNGGYPTVNGAQPPLAAIVLHVRGIAPLTFDPPKEFHGLIRRTDTNGNRGMVWGQFAK